jgi:phage pi2 protein 07
MSPNKLNRRRQVGTKLKKLADADEVLTPEEEVLVRKGEKELKEGKYVDWNVLKKKLKLT